MLCVVGLGWPLSGLPQHLWSALFGLPQSIDLGQTSCAVSFRENQPVEKLVLLHCSGFFQKAYFKPVVFILYVDPF